MVVVKITKRSMSLLGRIVVALGLPHAVRCCYRYQHEPAYAALALVALVALSPPPPTATTHRHHPPPPPPHTSKSRGLSASLLTTSHTGLTHALVGEVVRAGDTVVDATCGNGHDSLLLARHCLRHPDAGPRLPDAAAAARERAGSGRGRVVCIDAQPTAVERTRAHLEAELEPELASELDEHVRFVTGNHRDLEAIDDHLPPEGARCFIYNLGYLPGCIDAGGADGERTGGEFKSNPADTIESMRGARERLQLGGTLIVTVSRRRHAKPCEVMQSRDLSATSPHSRLTAHRSPLFAHHRRHSTSATAGTRAVRRRPSRWCGSWLPGSRRSSRSAQPASAHYPRLSRPPATSHDN